MKFWPSRQGWGSVCVVLMLAACSAESPSEDSNASKTAESSTAEEGTGSIDANP